MTNPTPDPAQRVAAAIEKMRNWPWPVLTRSACGDHVEIPLVDYLTIREACLHAPALLSDLAELRAERERGLDAFQAAQGAWSDSTFGVRDGSGALAHLRKETYEANEARGSVSQLVEYADCLMLLLDAARRDGHTASDVLRAAWPKLEINKKRQWGAMQEDGAVEHIR